MAKLVVRAMEGSAMFYDTFKLPSKHLDTARMAAFRVTKTLANEYRVLAGDPAKPIRTIHHGTGDTVYVTTLAPSRAVRTLSRRRRRR